MTVIRRVLLLLCTISKCKCSFTFVTRAQHRQRKTPTSPPYTMVEQARFGTVGTDLGGRAPTRGRIGGATMKTMEILLAGLASVVAFVSSANAASFSACQSIADPMQRLDCYDKAAKAPAPSRKTAAVASVPSAAFNAAPAKAIPVKAVGSVEPGPRYWIEAEGGIYGFSKNHPVLAATEPPATSGPTFVPTSPGFIGLFSTSTVTNPLATGTTPDFGGGGSYRMGYWLGRDPMQARRTEE
jgi:hypothetical protein